MEALWNPAPPSLSDQLAATSIDAGAEPEAPSGEGSREGQAESKAEGKNRARRKYVVAALDHLQHEFSEEFSEQNSTARSEVSSQGAPTGNRKTKSQSKKEQQAEAWLSAVSNCILLERLPARCVNLHRPINIPPRFCADAPAPCCPHVARPDLSRASLGRSTFAHRELEFVLKTAKPIHTVEGEDVFKQGDLVVSGMLYVVGWGRYRAVVRGQNGKQRRLRDFGPEDNFGAADLLCNDGKGDRAYSVEVIQPGLLWGIPSRIVQSKLRIPPAFALGAEVASFLGTVGLFKTLSKDRMAQLMRAAELVHLAPGEPVCKEGDKAQDLFVVYRGDVGTSQSDSETRITIAPPSILGESGLSADEELRGRGATVTAGGVGASLVRFRVLDVETLVGFRFQEVSLTLQNRMLLSAVTIGDRPLVEGLTKEGIDSLAEAMDELSASHGQVVADVDQLDRGLCVIKSGEAAVVKSLAKPAAARQPTVAAVDKAAARGVSSASAAAPGTAPAKRNSRIARSVDLLSSTSHATVTALRRGDFFGETGLLRDDHPARAQRRTSVVARGEAPLVVLMLTESALAEIDSLADWRAALTQHIEAVGVAGADLAILAKTGANQDDLSSAKGSKLSTGKKKRVGVAAGTSAAVSGSPAKGGSKGRSATEIS